MTNILKYDKVYMLYDVEAKGSLSPGIYGLLYTLCSHNPET